MATVRPFKAIRPTKELASKVASLPYDVMNREEAKEMAKGNPYSFLHIGRSEIDLDDSINPYDEIVYKTARANLDKMIQDGIMIQDSKPMYYIYRQKMDHVTQTGIVGCTSIDEYLDDTIKKHEFTRPEKEVDRINNFDYCDANTEPIFLTYKRNAEIDSIVSKYIDGHKPVYDFVTEDGISHILWVIECDESNKRIQEIFGGINYLYIADGHHRSASSVKVGLKRREQFPNFTGDEEFNFFMSVIFPDEDLYIMDYNRVVKDLNGHSLDEFMYLVEEKFNVTKNTAEGPYKPEAKHTFGMLVDGSWYKLTPKEGTYPTMDPVKSLDASILQDNLLSPILGIENPRTDKRIDFVGGIRGLAELERRVNKDMKIAFALYATSIEDLIKVADAGQVMPPKSTWFEPKLRSGLFVHKLSE